MLMSVGYVVRGREAEVVEVCDTFVGERHAIFKIKNPKTSKLEEECASFHPNMLAGKMDNDQVLVSHFFLDRKDAERCADLRLKLLGIKKE